MATPSSQQPKGRVTFTPGARRPAPPPGMVFNPAAVRPAAPPPARPAPAPRIDPRSLGLDGKMGQAAAQRMGLSWQQYQELSAGQRQWEARQRQGAAPSRPAPAQRPRATGPSSGAFGAVQGGASPSRPPAPPVLPPPTGQGSGRAPAPAPAPAPASGAPPARPPLAPDDVGDIGVPIGHRVLDGNGNGPVWDGVGWGRIEDGKTFLSSRANALGSNFPAIRQAFYPGQGPVRGGAAGAVQGGVSAGRSPGRAATTRPGGTGSWGYDRVESMRSAAAEMGDLEGTELGGKLRSYLNENLNPDDAGDIGVPVGARANNGAVWNGSSWAPAAKAAGDQALTAIGRKAFAAQLPSPTGFYGGQEKVVAPLTAKAGMNRGDVLAAFGALGQKPPADLFSPVDFIQADLLGSRGQGLPGMTRNLGFRDLGVDPQRFRLDGGQLNTFR